MANSSQSPVGLIAAAVSQRSWVRIPFNFLQSLTESAFEMRKKKTSNENKKKTTSFNKHHGTMHYCNVHYGLAHLTFPYAVYNTVQCCKWIIILLDSLYRYILDILFQFTCHISLKPVLPRGLFWVIEKSQHNTRMFACQVILKINNTVKIKLT